MPQHPSGAPRDDFTDIRSLQFWRHSGEIHCFEHPAANLPDPFAGHRPTEFCLFAQLFEVFRGNFLQSGRRLIAGTTETRPHPPARRRHSGRPSAGRHHQAHRPSSHANERLRGSWCVDLQFQTQRADNLQGFAELAGWFAFLQLDDETHACPRGHGQVLLRNLGLATSQAANAKYLHLKLIRIYFQP